MFNWKNIEQQIKKNLSAMNITDVKIRNLNTNFEQTTDLKLFFENYYPEMDMDIMVAQIQKEQNELSQRTSTPQITNNNDIVKEVKGDKDIIKSKLEFMPNQIMELPSQLYNILPESDVLYIYGVPRTDSFLMSIALIVNKNFLFFDNKKKKDDYIRDMKTQLTMYLKDYFHEKNYRLLGIKRSDMEAELFNDNELSDFNRLYVADHYKINIVIINLINKTYQLASVWNDKYPVVIMICENDVYLPVLNNKGENVFTCDVLKSVKMSFVESVNPLVELYNKKIINKQKKEDGKKFHDISKFTNITKEESESESDNNDNDTESEPESDIEINVKYELGNDDNDDNDESNSDDEPESIKPSVKTYNKSSISKMTLVELKDIAKEMNICLSKGTKKKRKGELVEDILNNIVE